MDNREILRKWVASRAFQMNAVALCLWLALIAVGTKRDWSRKRLLYCAFFAGERWGVLPFTLRRLVRR